MSQEAYLLGVSQALLERCRTYFIVNEDAKGLALIEDQYQILVKNIEKTIYGKLMEDKKDGF